mmetsp:Transcript_40098/g.100700  ORF Transcript_40098/g.100700 Transcript_40098/m.100700 type:complete len:238 (-) Transcript_40098:3-716(-)
MGLQTFFSGDSALEGLATADVLGHTLDQLIGQDVQHRGHSDGAIRASHVCLALIVHLEATLRAPHPHQKLVHLRAVHDLVSNLITRNDDSRHRSVRRRQMCQLARAASKSAFRVLAPRQEGTDFWSPLRLVVDAKHLHCMGDPEYEPRTRGVQARELCRELLQALLQPLLVQVSVQQDVALFRALRQEGLEEIKHIALCLLLVSGSYGVVAIQDDTGGRRHRRATRRPTGTKGNRTD